MAKRKYKEGAFSSIEQYGPVFDKKRAGKRRRGRPKGSKGKRNPLLSLKKKLTLIKRIAASGV